MKAARDGERQEFLKNALQWNPWMRTIAHSGVDDVITRLPHPRVHASNPLIALQHSSIRVSCRGTCTARLADIVWLI